MDAAQLARWTRFAAKGGIGKCRATCDCVAESTGDLMFLKDDEIVVLMQIEKEGYYLGYCEGVVGQFKGDHVHFKSKLKRPVMTKRTSVSTTGKQASDTASTSFGPLLPGLPRIDAPVKDVVSMQRQSLLSKGKTELTEVMRTVSVWPEEDSHSSPSSEIALANVHPPSTHSSPDPLLKKDSSLPTGQDEPSSAALSTTDTPSRLIEDFDEEPSTYQENGSHSTGAQATRKGRLQDASDTVESPAVLLLDTTTNEPADVGYNVDSLLPASTAPLRIQKKLSTSPSAVVKPDDSEAKDSGAPDANQSGSFLDESTARFSIAMSDGNEGIGLSLLRDLADGLESDDDEVFRPHRTIGSSSAPDAPNDESAVDAPDIPSFSAVSDSFPMPPSRPLPDNHQSSPSRDAVKRLSLTPSAISAGSWDGAADIYDDYRYSRFSLASHFSQGTKPVDTAPPVPDYRPSLDSRTNLDLSSEDAVPLSPLSQRKSNGSFLESEASTADLSGSGVAITKKGFDHDRSVDSDVSSVYTQASHQSGRSDEVAVASSLPGQGAPYPSSHPPESSSLEIATSSPPSPRLPFEADKRVVDAAPGSDPNQLQADTHSDQVRTSDDGELPSTSVDISKDTASALFPPESHVLRPQTSYREPSPSTHIEKSTINKRISPTKMDEAVVVPSAHSSLSTETASLINSNHTPRLRNPNPSQPPNDFVRRSIFLPHPNAPKAPATSSGPNYHSFQQNQPNIGASEGVNVIEVIKQALFSAGSPHTNTTTAPPGPTIYGQPTVDLGSSMYPVLIKFSVHPIVSVQNVSPSSSSTSASPAPSNAVQESVSGRVIPRANFFPKAPGVRPRSRSFSALSRVQIMPQSTSHAKGPNIEGSTDLREVPQSLSPASSAKDKSPLRSISLRPSFLRRTRSSLGPSRTGVHTSGAKPASSPLARSVAVMPDEASSFTFSQASSIAGLSGNLSYNLQHVASSNFPEARRVASLRSPPTQSERAKSPSSHPVILPSPKPEVIASTRSLPQGLPSSDMDTASVESSRSGCTHSVPTLNRQASLRTKLSLPNLRRNRGRQDESSTTVSSGSQVTEGEMLQVKDTDFELVRPNIPHMPSAQGNENSGNLGHEAPLDAKADIVTIPKSNSPSAGISPVDEVNYTPVWSPRQSPSFVPVSGTPTDSESSMDAHRQRELKWMAVLSSVSPSQSRKSKKVKKMLVDGVPSSVRYLVWSSLTNRKARMVPGVYSQFSGRNPVAPWSDIEREIDAEFGHYPHLQNVRDSVQTLLHAYLAMVPDVQFMSGLSLIAGHLLLLAPEEDAFWIFVSILDTHIRSYFSINTTQLEVDSALFSRALDANDALVSRKMFVDLGANPHSICTPWFSSLFVETLPSEYVNRVWDHFLFEGVPFLLRVALAVVCCCRHQVLSSKSEEQLLQLLRHPSMHLFPASSDAFLSIVRSVKLKDDDIRKQRVKMEAQVKRQTQTPRNMASPANAISLPRT